MSKLDIEVSAARPGDESQIAEVACAVKISLAEGTEESDRGFLVWPQSPETYRERLDLSEHFLVARAEDKVVGFLMAYSRPVLQELQRGMTYEDNILSFALSRGGQDIIFIDQIAVVPTAARRGVASRMLDHLGRGAPNAHLIAGIIHKPVRNTASIRFFQTHGSGFVCEVEQGEWTLGMYERLGPR